MEEEPEPVPLQRELPSKEETSPELVSTPPKEEKYDESEVVKMKEIFNTFAKKDTGTITHQDAMEILKNLNCNNEECNK